MTHVKPMHGKTSALLLAVAAATTAVGFLWMGLARGARSHPDLKVVMADPLVRQVSAAETDFGFRLLKNLTKASPNSNVFFSPFSISEALSMTMNGAAGKTRDGMASALGLQGIAPRDLNATNALLLPSLENPDPKVEMNIANAIWVSEDATLNPQFQQTSKASYDADAQTVDFNAPQTTTAINDWVKGHTQGKIDKIVEPGELGSSTAALLVNAVYFHGQWAAKFEKDRTADGPFTPAPGKTKTLPMMDGVGDYAYLETSEYQAVSLPYGAGRMSMVVMLPKSGKNLDAMIGSLNIASWSKCASGMRTQYIHVILPRFEVSCDAILNKPLSEMGMGLAFTQDADFSPMGRNIKKIKKVKHKAIMQVDEEGTVAAAATSVEMELESARMPNAVIRVDHPFFCAIRDSATGALVFAGAIRDPQTIK